jgi:hypothetical protein
LQSQLLIWRWQLWWCRLWLLREKIEKWKTECWLTKVKLLRCKHQQSWKNSFLETQVGIEDSQAGNVDQLDAPNWKNYEARCTGLETHQQPFFLQWRLLSKAFTLIPPRLLLKRFLYPYLDVCCVLIIEAAFFFFSY